MDLPPTSKTSTWQMKLQLRIDAFNTSTQYLADECTLADGPPLIEQRCIAYSTPKLADERMLADGPPKVLTSSGQEWQFHIATDI